MSYGMGFALQQAVFGVLNTDQAVTALVGDAVFDAAPAGEVPALYVQLGAEAVRDASDGTGGGAEHRFMVLIVTFERAVARQVGAEARRQIEMRFKARVQDG